MRKVEVCVLPSIFLPLRIFCSSAEASLSEVMVCVQVTAKFGLLGLFVAYVASFMLECTFTAICESYILT